LFGKEDTKLRNINRKYIVKQENFDALAAYPHKSGYALRWECLFVLPEWLRVWWDAFGGTADLSILSVHDQENVIGLAPLQLKGDKASFIGSTNVCDYLDFIVATGREGEFFDVLLNHLNQQGITSLDLGLLRADSTVLTDLVPVAENRECTVSTSSEDITLELELPATWEDYLGLLNGKQRHEVKRKLRRLDEAGDVNLRVVEDAAEIPQYMPTFFELFKMSSSEKAAFMTDQMTSFFQTLAGAMAKSKILKLYILELDDAPAAAALCFDFNATLHLYNSGFDPRFNALSVGSLCNVLSIKDAIQSGRQKYDFLKGAETYKHRLGGREISLYNCRIQL
jgi:CelD/BcsL family acetyltransferase involved in cellulose biosynthesis